MRSLSSTLTSAQKSRKDPICKIVLTKGANSYTYDWRKIPTSDTRIHSISHTEASWRGEAQVILFNHDKALTVLDFRGYTGTISYGFTTSAGDEWSASAPLKVISQRQESQPGRALTFLTLASDVLQLAVDRASADYLPTAANTDTIWTIFQAIMANTLSLIGTTDFLGAIKTLAAAGAVSIVLKSLGTGTINAGTKLTIAGDSAVYTVRTTATITANEATVTIDPILVAEAAADKVVTLTPTPFSHCAAVNKSHEDTTLDPVIDSFKPADFFKVYEGQTRRAKIQELLKYTYSAPKLDTAGGIKLVRVVNAHAADWAANTVYALSETVKPTTANGHIYKCTTAGTSHAATEPTWPTTEDDTVTDGTVVWTLTYDYQYSLTTGDHLFLKKGYRNALVLPNYFDVASYADHASQYSSFAKDTESNDLLDKREKVRLRLTSDDEASDIAKGMLLQEQVATDIGGIVGPMNVGQELYDLVRIYDLRDEVTLIGNVTYIRRDVGRGRFDMALNFGDKRNDLQLSPEFDAEGRSGEEVVRFRDLREVTDYIEGPVLNYVNESIIHIDGLIDAKIDFELAKTQFGQKIVYMNVIEGATTVTTGDGKLNWTVPSDLDGMNLVDADAAVYTVSTSGLPTIQIHNLTDVVDMLSTRITIDANEKTSYTAVTPAVIDTTKDDVATGDIIRIDVDVAGTGAAGLDIILKFREP